MNQTLWTYHTEPIVVISIISIICIITTIVIISYHFDILSLASLTDLRPMSHLWRNQVADLY